MFSYKFLSRNGILCISLLYPTLFPSCTRTLRYESKDNPSDNFRLLITSVTNFYFFLSLATQSGLELIPYVTGVVITSLATGQLISRTNFFAYRTISAMGAVLI